MTPIDKLKLLTAWNVEPTIDVDELGDTLASFALEDAAGLAPVDEEWSPTYNLNAAAAEAWLIKAGRASSLVEIDPPESGIVTSKIFDNCISMAQMYSRKCGKSVSVN